MSLVTKGTMIVRDVDLLAELARRAECTVCFSVTTVDLELSRKLEPGTPPPLKRLLALERLTQAGINAGVLLAPIIPGITDSTANLEAVARSAASHGAHFLSGNMLYLKPGTKEHFLGFLQAEYPTLLSSYRGLYPDAYPPNGIRSRVDRSVADLAQAYGLAGRKTRRPDAATQPQQLELALT